MLQKIDYNKFLNEAAIYSSAPLGCSLLPPFWNTLKEIFCKEVAGVLEDEYGYQQINLPPLIALDDMHIFETKIMGCQMGSKMVNVYDKHNKLIGYHAPTMVIPAIKYMKTYFKNDGGFPLRFFHIGSVIKHKSSSGAPFNKGPRNMYYELYEAYENQDDMLLGVNRLLMIMRRVLSDILMVPYIENERPMITNNNKVSEQTTCLDTFLPDGRTLQSAMLYRKGTLFTEPFGVTLKKKYGEKYPYVNHAGFTDNTLLGYMMYAVEKYGDDEEEEDLCLLLPHNMMPYHIVYKGNGEDESGRFPQSDINLIRELKTKGLRLHNLGGSVLSGRSLNVARKQNPYIYMEGQSDDLFTVRIMPTGAWCRNMSMADILELIDKLKNERAQKIIAKNARIVETRRISRNCIDVHELTCLVQEGFVIDVPILKQDADYILGLEKQIIGGEILGITTRDEGENNVVTIATIAKRK